jgi:hypothetical protein
MARFSVTTLSHPFALVVVYVAVLFDAVNTVPCQVYVSHPVIVSIDVVGCVITKSSIAVESHPAALVNIFVYEPVVLYDVPFQV